MRLVLILVAVGLDGLVALTAAFLGTVIPSSIDHPATHGGQGAASAAPSATERRE